MKQDRFEELLKARRHFRKEQIFDVFCSYNSVDRRVVETVARRLQRRGIQPWVDFWELRPGICWQDALEKQIRRMRCAAVFIGRNGMGPWHNLEQVALLREFVERGCPVIPVILPDVKDSPILPLFLKTMMWVDFRRKDQVDPLELLVWGIVGGRLKRSIKRREK